MELITTTALIVFSLIFIMELTKKPVSQPNELTCCKWKYSSGLFWCVVAVLVFVASFREGFVDTAVYKKIYSQLGTDIANVDAENLKAMERGFLVFMVMLNHISPDPQLMVIVTSVVTMGISLCIIKKYSYDLPLSLFLFLTLSYMGQMNGIRQVMAGAILQLAMMCLINRKPIPYIILVLLLSNFHTSILVMIPLYFVICGKRLNWVVLLFIVAVFLSFLMPDLAYKAMGQLLEDSVYLAYLDNEKRMGVMRLAVALCPLVLTIMMCYVMPRTGTKNDRLLDVLINAHIVNVGFVALGTTMVYFARIGMYVSFSMTLLLPRAIHELFDERSQKLARTAVVVLYGTYFLYQIYTYNSQNYFFDFKLIF